MRKNRYLYYMLISALLILCFPTKSDAQNFAAKNIRHSNHEETGYSDVSQAIDALNQINNITH